MECGEGYGRVEMDEWKKDMGHDLVADADASVGRGGRMSRTQVSQVTDASEGGTDAGEETDWAC